MVSGKGPSRGATGDAVHHGCFHFQIVPLVEEVTQGLHDHGAGAENATGIFVHDQIYVALTVAHLLICQAMELFRKRLQGLVEQHHLVGMNAQLALIGAH